MGIRVDDVSPGDDRGRPPFEVSNGIDGALAAATALAGPTDSRNAGNHAEQYSRDDTKRTGKENQQNANREE